MKKSLKILAIPVAIVAVYLFWVLIIQPDASVIYEDGDSTKRVIGIENLQIKDRVFDVDFVGGSFNDNFDLSGTDSSKMAPRFWNDYKGASCAALTIGAKLDSSKFTVSDSTYRNYKSDRFYVPFKMDESGRVYAANDRYADPNRDQINNRLYLDVTSCCVDVGRSSSVWAKFKEKEPPPLMIPDYSCSLCSGFLEIISFFIIIDSIFLGFVGLFYLMSRRQNSIESQN
ncbi:hypothetical protein [Coleofasciculus chthonoplastes]|uniref:hypothetical protein n=1 Tax=Coleofasciculus chthonoplastes TaxID=64178 RepID=UPI0032F189C4